MTSILADQFKARLEIYMREKNLNTIIKMVDMFQLIAKVDVEEKQSAQYNINTFTWAAEVIIYML